MSAYSGALQRAMFHRRPPVPGVNPEHVHPSPDPDPFSPVPDTPSGQTGDVWSPADVAGHTTMGDERIHHWTDLYAPVPSNVPSETSALANQARFIANHSRDHYRADTIRAYPEDATISRAYIDGRGPWQGDDDVPDDMAHLVMGRNAYPRTNAPTDVYGSEPSRRYRLGGLHSALGTHEFWTLQGQDCQLRAYVGMHPQFPTDKDQITTQPVIPNSRGTDTWTLPTWQTPRLFSVPSETASTDYETGAQDESCGYSPFRGDDRL